MRVENFLCFRLQQAKHLKTGRNFFDLFTFYIVTLSCNTGIRQLMKKTI